ncbi:PucR family transcriptional regulator [Priestia megaterium]|uniref:PucR family transcriptional regulator n=1 Tax=Priestia megaterium TaxID=1404 RepID=UPI00366FD251
MLLSELMSILTHVSIIRAFTNQEKQIVGVKLLKDINDLFKTDYLYIGRVSDLPTEPPLPHTNFLCIGDISIPPSYTDNVKFNICIVSQDYTYDDIFSLVFEMMDQEASLAVCGQIFFKAVYENKGLQHLVNVGRDLLGHPMLVHDTTFKILASSHDAREIITFYEDKNHEKYVHGETISYIRKNNILEQVRKEGIPHYVSKLNPLHGTIVSLIHIEGVEVAQLAIYEAGLSFKETEIKIIELFVQALSIELQKNVAFDINKSLIPSYILGDLLEEKYQDEELIRQRFQHLKWTQSKDLSIMVITSLNMGSFDSKSPFIIQTLRTFIPTNQCVIYRSALIVFLDEKSLQILTHTRKQEFVGYLERNLLFAGVSLSYSSLSKSRKYYLQALKAREVGQRYDMNLSLFENIQLHVIADMISTQYDVVDFCHPAVLQLKKEDKENGTDLLNTLKHYIYFTNTPNKAAKLLCIHRNTLFYRINKIKQLTGITLSHGEEILKIYASIKLLEIDEINFWRTRTAE